MLNEAEFLYREQSFEQSIAKCMKLLDLEPSNFKVRLLLALNCLKLERLDDAILHFNKCFSLSHENFTKSTLMHAFEKAAETIQQRVNVIFYIDLYIDNLLTLQL